MAPANLRSFQLLLALIGITPLAVFGIALNGQCGGIGWAGSGTCDAPYACVVINAYYYQCLAPSASATTTSVASGKASTVLSPTPLPTGLDAYMKSHGKKYYGICVDSLQTSSVGYGALTPMNSAKWDTTEPSRGIFNFGSFDTFINYAQSNGKLIRGHTFVWHSQLPSWVSSISDATTLTAVIQNHISTIAKRYAGKVYARDVVNE
ncbi:hypothetical protein BDV93DRAFT_508565 [Ceratobasidium sp. AG-I]|nr:hypothetical protein BDV93DRAFT_508565 [Ceratobasidium sp. AG-I]